LESSLRQWPIVEVFQTVEEDILVVVVAATE
jgi:hypothetical protein